MPFEHMNIPDNDGYWYNIYCINCGAEGSNEITKEEAIKSWNRRVD